MSNKHYTNNNQYQSEIYEICIQGHLQDKWAEWFEGMTITRQEGGTTTLCGPLHDQTALHSVLLKIRDMNLKIISVKEIQVPHEDKA